MKICIKGLHGPDFSGPGLAQPAISAQLHQFFFFRFWLRLLVLSDFKNCPFSFLYILNVFFCWWFTFLQYYLPSFFCSQTLPLKNSFLFFVRMAHSEKNLSCASPAHWKKNQPSCASPLGKSPLFWKLVHWKKHFSCTGLGQVRASGKARSRVDL